MPRSRGAAPALDRLLYEGRGWRCAPCEVEWWGTDGRCWVCARRGRTVKALSADDDGG